MKSKLILALLPLFIIVFAIHSVIIYQDTYQEVLTSLESEARDIRGLLMATRRIYHDQFIGSGLPVNDTTIGFLPAHAMGRISKDFSNWTDSGIDFNNVSDRARNPDNAADEIELEAMKFFRENPDVEHRFTMIDGDEPIYHYTEPIWIEQYCLSCHGNKEDAPESVAARYSESYGYELGDLRGVMSIKMPVGRARVQARDAVVDNLIVNFIGYSLIFLAVYFLNARFAIRPLQKLVEGSRELALGNYDWRSGIGGTDEIAGIADAFDSMADQIGDRDSRLRQSERRLRGISETAADAIITSDSSGRVISWNHAAERIFEYTEEEGCALSVADLVASDFQAGHEQKFNEAVASFGASFTNGRTLEGISVKKDGTEFPIQISLSIWKSEEELYFTAIIRDMTEHKLLEEQLKQSQKMDAVGQLAGGIAHDFNNLLHVIDGYGDLAIEKTKGGESVEIELEKITQASDKAAVLIRQILAFSRRQILDLTVLSLSDVVEQMGEMIQRIIGEQITINIACEPELPLVNVDRGMLEQILMNLCVNARDAMPEGGILDIETAKADLDVELFGPESEYIQNAYVVLRVSDTGVGMTTEVQEHLFEPFFTTKPQGEGTGLGLSTVYGLVKQHDGEIRVQSEPGVGTSFNVYFPATLGSPTQRKIVSSARAAQGDETILVADDDDGVRTLSRIILERAGYTVLTAVDGKDAVEIFRARHDTIDLVILDVVMPELGGKAAHDVIKKESPGVPVLFASGYSMGAIHKNYVLDEGMQLIQKPYHIDKFLTKVRSMIDFQDPVID